MTVRVLRWIATGVAGVVAVAALVLLSVMVLVPMVTGWVPLTIASGSMTPTYDVGTQVYVERVESQQQVDALRAGDVISFMPRPNDLTMVTHRIVGVEAGADGTRRFVTRGDANNAPDTELVERQMIRGKVRYAVPYVGYVATLLDGQQKRVGILVAAGVLFAYAAVQLLLALRRRGGGGALATAAERPPVRTGATRWDPATTGVAAVADVSDATAAPLTRAAARRQLQGSAR